MTPSMGTPPFPPGFPPEFPPSRGEPGREPSPLEGPGDVLADRLLERRIVLATGPLDTARATDVSARLVTLDAAAPEPVTLLLRAPDGDLEASFAVADTIGVLASSVHAVIAGQTGGPPLAVLAAAERRDMMPHATLRLTEPQVRIAGAATDVASREEEHRRLTEAFYARLAEATGRDADEIRADARQGRMFTCEEAIAYGLAHGVASRTSQ